MRNKKIKMKHIFIGILAIIIVIMVVLSHTLKEEQQLNKPSSFLKDSVVKFEDIIFYPFKYVFNKINDYKELKSIRQKYQTLLPEIDRIDSLETENIELRKQLENLKDELSIDYSINDYDYLNATVVYRNVSYWYNTITIDKGTYNGVEVDMAVVNSKGLIGKVVSTTAFTSDIKLITTSDTNNKISITVSNGGNKINGLIKNYNYKTKFLEVEGISNTEKVNVGDYVYTSGLGGIFPSGILIGKVANITTDEYDLAKIIDVEPIADFDDINYVAILKRKENKK